MQAHTVGLVIAGTDTRWTELVGVRRPFQQAAMSRVTTPELVVAVSNAGGLGMLPVGRGPVDVVTGQIDSVAASTDKPFGAGFVMPFLDLDCLEAVVAKVDVVEFAFGWPDDNVIPADSCVGWMVGTVDEAKAAVDAGCAYVIAQGTEAGGHVRDDVPLSRLLPAVREAVDVAVVATGGLGTRSAVEAAFDMGADAVRIGTRLLGAVEANVHPRYLALLTAATADDTVSTKEFQAGWPGPPEAVRILSSALEAARQTDLDPVGCLGDRDIPRFGTTPPVRETTGLIEAMALYAGTSVGALSEVDDAASIIDELIGDR